MDLPKLTAGVIALSKEVGEFIRREALVFELERVEYKGLHDMVSYVDKTAEISIVKGLKALLPEAGFVTEEKTATITGEKYDWIIDPLDGTTNFIHGLPTYSISIALQCNNELILGVVYEINRDECFSAWKNGGAYLNNKRIRVSKASPIENTLLATGFPYYEFGKLDAYLAVLKELMQRCHGVRRIGSAAIDLAYVACGRFDGYFEFNLNSYDVAAGMVLVREAGGEIFDFSGGNDSIEKREMVATNGLISAELLFILEDKFTSFDID
ncbi:MAG: inositol monophosphatase family protein [Daejeonella sp.]|uniref:inositol monophosphatase family protein n=1 Tax=Daejeonella sp. TaxID=2805397 RepID=UPI002732ACA2|nr:inositol monophosphatase family protein [Daejeonella sp.]MDP3468109.1 inositol monophosphatase family protein [Daejeonella sp.]